MKTKTFLTRYELTLFFLLAYLLSWWPATIMNGNLLPYGPALAAVIILALRDDKPETRAFWRRCLNWRAGWWYLAGPAIIVAYLLAAFAINLSVGASITHPLQLPSPATLIILLLMGGIWEEPGWTEYALPRLQDRFAGR